MSKHINFVCNDTLYSSIVEYMKTNNIKNYSWAIRILICEGLRSKEEDKRTETPKFSNYIDCFSLEDII